MKTTIKDISVFVKNNPQHFKSLHAKVATYLDKLPPQTCGICPKAAQAFQMAKENALDFGAFVLCDEEVRKLIIDKCKILLDDVVEIEDFSVNNCGESDKNK